MKNKIIDSYYLELMDRLYVETCNIQNNLIDHPVTEESKKVKKLINRAHNSLCDAYQLVGSESYKNYEKESGISKVVFGRRKSSKD